MIDLTGANLVAYLLRIIRDIVEKNPRFRRALGDVTFPAMSNPTTALRWKDLQVIVKNVTSSGNRLSPDYFMKTELGRAILCKVADKDGLFVEWTREIDPTRQTPIPGVYMMNIDFVDERTRDIGVTVHTYRWATGRVKNAQGTIVTFAAGIIDPSTAQPVDLSTLIAIEAETGNPISFVASNSSLGGTIALTTPCQTLNLKFSNGTALTPNIQYWYERLASFVICQSTIGGRAELVNITQPYVSLQIVDQTGYVLRPGIDYQFQGPQWITLGKNTPVGSILTANAIVKVNPYGALATNPENILQTNITSTESLVPDQIFIHTTIGDYTTATPNTDGTITLPTLLLPGQWMYWEARIDTGQVKTAAKKLEINSLAIVDPNTIEYVKITKGENDQPVRTSVTAAWVASADASQLEGVIQASAGKPLLTNGQRTYALPGLWLAFGDLVIEGDQAAVVVSPTTTETYQVYGSKENLTFELDVKSNDLQTSSDLSEMIKQYLLITSRINTETDGLTIFEIGRGFTGEARDPSGTASNYTYTLTVTASADWKVYKPLMTRLVSYEITNTATLPDYVGKLQATPRMKTFGRTTFVPLFVPDYV